MRKLSLLIVGASLALWTIALAPESPVFGRTLKPCPPHCAGPVRSQDPVM